MSGLQYLYSLAKREPTPIITKQGKSIISVEFPVNIIKIIILWRILNVELPEPYCRALITPISPAVIIYASILVYGPISFSIISRHTVYQRHVDERLEMGHKIGRKTRQNTLSQEHCNNNNNIAVGWIREVLQRKDDKNSGCGVGRHVECILFIT